MSDPLPKSDLEIHRYSPEPESMFSEDQVPDELPTLDDELPDLEFWSTQEGDVNEEEIDLSEEDAPPAPMSVEQPDWVEEEEPVDEEQVVEEEDEEPLSEIPSDISDESTDDEEDTGPDTDEDEDDVEPVDPMSDLEDEADTDEEKEAVVFFNPLKEIVQAPDALTRRQKRPVSRARKGRFVRYLAD